MKPNTGISENLFTKIKIRIKTIFSRICPVLFIDIYMLMLK